WILSLDKKVKSLPAKGAVNATINKPVMTNGVLTISAAYTDNGGANNSKPLMGSNSIWLRNSMVTFQRAKNLKEFSKTTVGENTYLTVPDTRGWFSIDRINLTDIARASLSILWEDVPASACAFEIHLDSPEGNIIGAFSFAGKEKNTTSKAGAQPVSAVLTTDLKQVNDGKVHSIYIVKTGDTKQEKGVALSAIQFYLK
ncbi:MAG: hypothetical protein ABIP35_09665, partial [Ginsengibacter sp.]